MWRCEKNGHGCGGPGPGRGGGGQASRKRMPIVRTSEKPMQNQDGRTILAVQTTEHGALCDCNLDCSHNLRKMLWPDSDGGTWNRVVTWPCCHGRPPLSRLEEIYHEPARGQYLSLLRCGPAQRRGAIVSPEPGWPRSLFSGRPCPRRSQPGHRRHPLPERCRLRASGGRRPLRPWL